MSKYEDRKALHREYLRSVGRAGGPDSKKKLEELGLVQKGHWPKHEQAYRVIQGAFSDFEWVVRQYGHKEGSIVFKNYPMVDGKEPSLADLAEEALRPLGVPPKIVIDDFSPSVKITFMGLIENTRTGKEFGRLFLSLPAILPSPPIMNAITEWVKRLEAGEPSTVFCTVCPDYEVRETGDQKRPYEYTFEKLGSGIGLVAKQAFMGFTKLWEFFKRHGLEVKFVVAMADCEADSEENCKRVGLTRAQFLARIRKSQRAFRSACPNDMIIETPLLTRINPKLWRESLEAARLAVARHDYGALDLGEVELYEIYMARKSLYERWYGARSYVALRKILDSQAAEYMAPAVIAERCYPNTLILGADAVIMAPFAQGLTRKVRPVLYVRSAEY